MASSVCKYPICKYPVLSALVFLLNACASQTHNTAEQLPIIVNTPRQLAGFHLYQTEQHPHATTGRQISYRHDELGAALVDVFVYDGGIYANPATAAMELAKLNDLLLTQAMQENIYHAAQRIHETQHHWPQQMSRGQASAASDLIPVVSQLYEVTSHSGRKLLSYAFHYYLPPYSVKVRATFPGSGNRQFDTEIERMARELVLQLREDVTIRCERNTTIHPIEAGASSWVSFDGHDIFVARESSDEAIETTMASGLRRMMEWRRGCPNSQDTQAKTPPPAQDAAL